MGQESSWKERMALSLILKRQPIPSFTKQEHLRAGKLRDISQTDLLQRIKDDKRVALVFRDELEAVILDYESYERMYQAVELLEEMLENQEISSEWGHRLKDDLEKFQEIPEGTRLSDIYRSLKSKESNG